MAAVKSSRLEKAVGYQLLPTKEESELILRALEVSGGDVVAAADACKKILPRCLNAEHRKEVIQQVALSY